MRARVCTSVEAARRNVTGREINDLGSLLPNPIARIEAGALRQRAARDMLCDDGEGLGAQYAAMR